jgi:hypothetical protein
MHDFQPDPEFKVIQAPPSALPFTRMGIHEIFGNILVPSHQNFNIGDNIKVEIQFNDLLVEGFSWVATKLFDFPTRVYRKVSGFWLFKNLLL